MNPPVVVLDNGASTIKAGLTAAPNDVKIVPNAIVRSKGDKTTYFGHELERCRDYSSLHYRLPFEKGYLVDWDAQKAVWDGIFSSQLLGVNTTEHSLLITEPYFNLPNIQDVCDQFVFEEYEFESYYRCTSASLIPHGRLFSSDTSLAPECIVVVDSGFSFTHVVPIINNQIQRHAIKRLDVGGKLLTNHLKELISYRQWNMMDETYIMNHVKESCCYVSGDFLGDLEVCRLTPKQNPIVQEYILPDFSSNRKGRVRRREGVVPANRDNTSDRNMNIDATNNDTRDTDQILVMENERFAIPEIIFRPDDIGLPQSGLPQTIASSIALLPADLQGLFWANIGLVGGNTLFQGFRERLLTELRSLAPIEFDVVVYECADPITEPYTSALSFASQPEYFDHVVTRAEYMESGSGACRRKFGGMEGADRPEGNLTSRVLQGDKGKERERDGRAEEGDGKKGKGRVRRR